ncbi:hypothetical protein F383_20677 [Gossypium arboreum]|uniref:Uncharacterized protein n=1 Tax=Gossypium arboreum TaxID=29729 RepID=A0A0B0NYS2_GOSAR|nr:hypothetical protein F383_20677 [Gossypium arboreum]
MFLLSMWYTGSPASIL